MLFKILLHFFNMVFVFKHDRYKKGLGPKNASLICCINLDWIGTGLRRIRNWTRLRLRTMTKHGSGTDHGTQYKKKLN